MATNKSDLDTGASDHRDCRDRDGRDVEPHGNRTADRKARLAAQLRENLKKRKELARARKNARDDEI